MQDGENENGNGQQRDAVSNWSVLESSELFGDPSSEQGAENNGGSDENGQGSQEGAEQGGSQEENSENQENRSDKEEGGENQGAEENAESQNEEQEPPTLEIGIEDVEGLKPEPEDGTWLAVGKAMGVEPEDDSFEAYSQAVERKYAAEIEKAKALSKEDVFATLKPETVAALKLIEAGIPEEMVFAPTKQIDSYLAMEDAELIREDLKMSGWTEDKIDTELEILTEKGWLKHSADKLRLGLENEKAAIIAQRQQILEQYNELSTNSAQRQQQEKDAQIKEALDTVPGFMGANLKPELKQAIWEKYRQGAYDKDLSSPQAMAELILYKELHQKILKNVENTAYQRGRDEKTKKLLNVPPLEKGAGNRVVQPKQFNNFEILGEDFGDK